jgi:hypothetical protein
MNTSFLAEIEKKIRELSKKEQLWLIEKLAHHLRESAFSDQSIIEKQHADMAFDSEIQSELKKINQEFVLTELDGIEKL